MCVCLPTRAPPAEKVSNGDLGEGHPAPNDRTLMCFLLLTLLSDEPFPMQTPALTRDGGLAWVTQAALRSWGVE